jgi:hypothetical protein
MPRMARRRSPWIRWPTCPMRPSGLISTCTRSPGRGHSYRCTGTGGAVGSRFNPKRRSHALTVDARHPQRPPDRPRWQSVLFTQDPDQRHRARWGLMRRRARSGRGIFQAPRRPPSLNRRTHFATVRTLNRKAFSRLGVAPPFKQDTRRTRSNRAVGVLFSHYDGASSGASSDRNGCVETPFFSERSGLNNVFSKDN